MILNVQLVKHSRQQRGWTQQHLADICGLSLRTIQRIEKNASASNETLAALAAVFEITQEELIAASEDSSINQQIKKIRRINFGLIISGVAGAIVGAIITYLILR